MSRYGKHKNYYQYQHDGSGGKDVPSFSSTLLDAIYRSFDESSEEEKRAQIDHEEEAGVVLFKETTITQNKHKSGTITYNNSMMAKMKKSSSSSACLERRERSRMVGDDDIDSRSQPRLIDEWMDSDKIDFRRKSTAAAEFEAKFKKSGRDSSLGSKLKLNSSSSSSESSYGGHGFSFSSSDAESFSSSSASSASNSKSLKSIRIPQSEQKAVPKHDRSFGKTRSRAMKIYGDLKNVKQPISPGGRLASFLNSLFNAAAATGKKPKTSSSVSKSERESKSSSHSSACSSASSVSRSCLSKTPSSSTAARFEQKGLKRSVRFCPESVITKQEEKAIATSATDEAMNPFDYEFKRRIMEESRRIEEVARDLLKSYQRKGEVGDGYGDAKFKNIEEEGDDNASCCSSDLFELDNFLEIGVDRRYSQELPVYETTNVDTNRAIANGFIV
ncbi:hypothetical protein Ancab_012585 [Ancistrocladus abbreviatus]